MWRGPWWNICWPPPMPTTTGKPWLPIFSTGAAGLRNDWPVEPLPMGAYACWMCEWGTGGAWCTIGTVAESTEEPM